MGKISVNPTGNTTIGTVVLVSVTTSARWPLSLCVTGVNGITEESSGGASYVPHLGWCCPLQPRMHASLTHYADMHDAMCHSLVQSGKPLLTYYATQLTFSCAGACPHLLR